MDTGDTKESTDLLAPLNTLSVGLPKSRPCHEHRQRECGQAPRPKELGLGGEKSLHHGPSSPPLLCLCGTCLLLPPRGELYSFPSTLNWSSAQSNRIRQN